MKFLLLLSLLVPILVFSQSSVTWKTSKRMFLVSTQEVVGINNSVKVETGMAPSRYIKLIIPIAKFNSGEPERDQEVQKILKANISPNLIFQSRLFKPKEYQKILAGEVDSIDGELTIGKGNFPIAVQLELSGNFLTGKFKGTFSQFKIAPPKVVGGVVAKVKDKLELTGRIDLNQLK